MSTTDTMQHCTTCCMAGFGFSSEDGGYTIIRIKNKTYQKADVHSCRVNDHLANDVDWAS